MAVEFRMTTDFSQLKKIRESIIADVVRRSDKANAKLIDPVVSGIQENIDTEGFRGPGTWDKVSLFWLRQRKTWPDKENFGKFTPTQLSFVRNHIPLDDTGSLLNSFGQIGESLTGTSASRTISSTSPNLRQIGFVQNFGIRTSDGPLDPIARDHMHIADEDVDSLGSTWVEAFRRA